MVRDRIMSIPMKDARSVEKSGLENQKQMMIPR